MGKHKEKKRKSGDLSETVSASPPASEKLQKGHVRTNNDAESPVTDILKSLESFSKKPKKKKKKKHLSEQDAGSDAEAPREHVKVKQEETFKQEAVNDIEIDEHFANTEEPTRKKKKRKRAKEVNEATESVAQSNENSGEPSPKKKKKKRHVSDENTAEEVNLTSKGTQSSADVGKKKKHKSKDKKARPVFTTQETFPKTSRQNMKENNSEIEMASESPLIDPNLLMQLKEFIPDIESKEQVNVSKMIKYDLPRFQEFKQQGISVNHGRFTAQENERLRKNVKDFMALTAIDNPSKLFFTHRFKQEQENLKRLKGLHKFFERIAEGIPRSCFYIYARGRRMFDEQNYQGEFSKAELKNLNKFHTLHGNNWKKISELTGRSALALQKRYTQIADKEGPWSEKEVQRLLRAVHDYIVSQIPGGANRRGSIRVMKETLYKRLPLQKIAMKVKTRSWTQCREKWMGILAKKMSFGSILTEKKSLDVQIKLIKGMYEMDIDDAARVNWEDLTAQIGDLPPAYLQRKWHKLKVCHVPQWQTKGFADTIDFLYENILPKLEQKLMSYQDLDETQHKENEESYLLSDIFQDINEDENVDDDDDDDDEEGSKNKGNKREKGTQ
ncbi:transcription termination factor 1-like [Silurus meridionalis]|uniref:Myb-like domain-containing protein n=1 Tax=Silurus meridionalis TaxID=175797 RepID=A0A8T0A8Z5_SILME|nr:transcription termination factor 1-like [Silurus meridionalis]XP_046697564.1 transcription termination factor 1-like [Silurus meridionalis]KAF7687503.1 hypothetical protein HF521_014731 [Silurus meridionalis]